MGQTISFGPFTFDPSIRTLVRNGNPVPLGGRAAALLSALAEAGGAVVTKGALITAVWPDVVVEEGNLSVQIAALRKVLGTRPDGQEWIATVPRVGYWLRRGDAAAQGAAAVPQIPLVAVLPFDNLSGDAEQDYFAAGMAEDIITALSRFRSFGVVSRNSSFAFRGGAQDIRQVAAALGVRYVLEGSVRRSGGRLRINAQLVDGEAATHLWAQSYDGPVGDVFDMQDRITESVVGIVEPRIELAEIERSRRERPGSIAAYDLYLRALPLILSTQNEPLLQGMALLEDAIALEPRNALFLAWAAQAMQMRVFLGFTPAGPNPKQRDYAERALREARGDATVLAQCADVLMHGHRDYARALHLARQAIESNPNNVSAVRIAGVIQLLCGSLDEAVVLFKRAVRLNPADSLQALPFAGLGHAAIVRGQYDEAVEWGEKAVARVDNYPAGHWMLAAGHAYLGNRDEAARQRDEILRISPGATIATIRATQPDKDPSRVEPVLEGLRLAGIPEV